MITARRITEREHPTYAPRVTGYTMLRQSLHGTRIGSGRVYRSSLSVMR